MHRKNFARTAILALMMSSFLVACGDDGDSQRVALERESLERELQLALQPDSTQQPTLNDVPVESIDEIVPPSRAEPAPASNPTPEPSPVRTPPAREPAPSPRPERAPTPAPSPSPTPAAPRVVSHTVPAGSSFGVRLNERLSTSENPVGSTFTATLTEAILARDGSMLIPAGATVRGRVVASSESGRAGEDATLAIDFTSIEHAGQTYAITGAAVNTPVRLVTDSRTEQAAKIGGGAAVGALLGQIVGGNTKSTIAGAAIGAAAGTAVAMGTADVDAVVDEGSSITVRLDRPVTIDRRE